jgi:hypothetical protein
LQRLALSRNVSQRAAFVQTGLFGLRPLARRCGVVPHRILQGELCCGPAGWWTARRANALSRHADARPAVQHGAHPLRANPPVVTRASRVDPWRDRTTHSTRPVNDHPTRPQTAHDQAVVERRHEAGRDGGEPGQGPQVAFLPRRPGVKGLLTRSVQVGGTATGRSPASVATYRHAEEWFLLPPCFCLVIRPAICDVRDGRRAGPLLARRPAAAIPSIQAIWLADCVTVDEKTDKVTAVGLFDHIDVAHAGYVFSTEFLLFALRDLGGEASFSLQYAARSRGPQRRRRTPPGGGCSSRLRPRRQATVRPPPSPQPTRGS